jgi:hypothetical protein
MTELEAVAARFDHLTKHVLQGFERRLELARAENDSQAVIKEQIKIEVLNAARGMYAGCHNLVTKRRPWQEENTP